MKLKKKRHNFRSKAAIVSFTALLATGGYILALSLSPLLISSTINPKDNSTTKILSNATYKPSEDRLYIPAIDINLPYSAGNETVMEKGAWWRVPENGNPRDGGNFVLSAHRFVMGLTPQRTLLKSPFYNIDKLKVEDKIIVDFAGKRYEYAIRKISSVKPDAVEIEARTELPQLTLYSCTLGGENDGREVITATLLK